MHREMLIACLPWLGLIAVGVGVVRLLARFSGARLRPSRLWGLPQDQVGSVQSLSFVLTLPLFIMVMMFIVQMSQLAIGTIVVHYAAYAAARAAIVWVPARVVPDELENAVSSFGGLSNSKVYDPTAKDFGPIARAAVLACVPISPSRSVSGGRNKPRTAEALVAMYQALLTEQTANNARIPVRLANKLAYSLEHTTIDITPGYSRPDEPLPMVYANLPLRTLPDPFLGDDPNELWTPGSWERKVGWQDAITVTVYHDFALLPGPGRLLAHRVESPGRIDTVADEIHKKNDEYVYQIKASATLGNEGERSVLPYVFQADQIRD